MKITLAGKDGVWVSFDADHNVGLQGTDGRIVVVKRGAKGQAGSNGRLIPVRPGDLTAQGADGQLVAFLPGDNLVIGDDGRAVRIPKGWTWIESAAGRIKPVRPRQKTF